MNPTPEGIYAAAYQSHYKRHDVDAAREGYERVRSLFPDSPEAGYAKAQLENLATAAPKLERKRATLEANEALARPHGSVVVTTAPSIEGRPILETLDVVSSEVVLGLNLVQDLLATITDVMGGRSASMQVALRDARRECLDEIRREAASLGANAVVATSIAYSEVSGGGKSMLFVVAVGTAVKARSASEASATSGGEP